MMTKGALFLLREFHKEQLKQKLVPPVQLQDSSDILDLLDLIELQDGVIDDYQKHSKHCHCNCH